MPLKILSVVGARPNFIKIAPFVQAINRHNSSGNLPAIEHLLVHTGQHYDASMSRQFFIDLNIPEADIHLDVGSGTHAEQVGQTMIGFEKVLRQQKPDWVVVVGDVNATLACSITAKKEWIRVCHIEAGLRSGDMQMPEEINRIVTDRVSDLLLTPDETSTAHLQAEGMAEGNIIMVGNIMIDSLEANRFKAEKLSIRNILRKNRTLDTVNLTKVPDDGAYGVVTLHRPSNVDDKEILKSIVELIVNELTSKLTIIWPLHPRTLKHIHEFGLFELITLCRNLILLEPIGYLEMLRLTMGARLVLTDSGGLQEECTVFGTPCITIRKNTERPVTLLQNGGTSVLAGNTVGKIREAVNEAFLRDRKPYRPPLWDGNTAGRCLNAIIKAH